MPLAFSKEYIFIEGFKAPRFKKSRVEDGFNNNMNPRAQSGLSVSFITRAIINLEHSMEQNWSS